MPGKGLKFADQIVNDGDKLYTAIDIDSDAKRRIQNK